MYACCGDGESTTDIVFGGHCLIAENGVTLAESKRFDHNQQLLVADIDMDRLLHDRVQMNTFHDANRVADLGLAKYRTMSFDLDPTPRQPKLVRAIDPHPFVPSDPATLDERLPGHLPNASRRARPAALAHRHAAGVDWRFRRPRFRRWRAGGVQNARLARHPPRRSRLGAHDARLRHFNRHEEKRHRPRAAALDVSIREIDIRQMCLDQMRAIGHAPFGLRLEGETVESLTEKLRKLPPENRNDLTFENTQARVRTSLLMNRGFVIGTGDLSELALGWCTYNADHMSMYNPNVSIPKTLVKFLVKWAAENEIRGCRARNAA